MLYPEIEPYDHGFLDAGDGHRVYYEQCGNPAGKPALVLHGGPGSGCSVGSRRPFDPERYRVVLMDQRGSGRSTPHAGDDVSALVANTTHHLLADIELLRTKLGIQRWLIFGGSWGTTLGLAYAERHPERVSEMVLASIATTTRSEVDWITRGVGAFFPEAFDRFRSGVPEAERDGPMVEAYHRLLVSADEDVRTRAAKDWCDWEMAIVAVTAGHKPSPRYADPRFRLGFARMVTHYWRHAAWLEDGSLTRDAHRLAGIPGILIHGRIDLGGPAKVAWDLHRAWPGSELIILGAAGHDARDPGQTETLVAALDRFAS